MITINKESCKNCHFCVITCPAKIFKVEDDKKIGINMQKEHTCLKCGQCMSVCETKSIFIDEMTYEKDFFEIAFHEQNFEEFSYLISTRRSVRNFKKQPVPKELLQKIIDSLSYTPYGSLPQSVSITIINNRDIIEKGLPIMSAFLRKIEKWLSNPFMRMMIKKRKGIETLNTLENHLLPRIKVGHYDLTNGSDNITRNAPAIILFHSALTSESHTEDAFIYANYTMLAAHAMGLGATIIGLVPAALNKEPELKKLFKIPENHETVTSVIVGYPKIKYLRGIIRKKKVANWIE
jgi:nitroreductase/NAD-dependent dihydropyrimidine dehydrogenase PreA subunit